MERPHNKTKWHLPLVYLLIFCSLLAAALPTFLSLSFMKPLIENRLSHLLKGEVSIRNIHLSWFTSQSLEGFHYTSKDNIYTFEFKSLESSATLFKYLITPYLHSLSDRDMTKLTAPTLTLHKEAPLSKEPTSYSFPGFLLHNLIVENGSLISPSSKLHQIGAHLQLQRRGVAALSLKGLSWIDQIPGQFEIQYLQGQGVIPRLFDLSFEQFPLIAIDALMPEYDFIDWLGPTLTAQIALKNTQNKQLISCKIHTDLIESSAQGQVFENKISLIEPLMLSWIFTPKSFKALLTHLPSLQSLALTRNASMQMTCSALDIPYDASSLLFHKAGYSAKLETSLIALSTQQEPLAINAFSCLSSSEQLDSSLTCSLQTSFNYGLKNPSYINASCHLNEIFKKPLLQATKELNIEVSKFPTSLLATHLSPLLPQLIGENINLQVISTALEGDKEYLVSVSSPQIQLKEAHLKMQAETLFLSAPVTAIYTPNPSYLQGYLSTPWMQATTSGKLYATVESLNWNFTRVPIPSKDRLQFNLQLRSEDISTQFNALPGDFVFKNTELLITKELTGIDLLGSCMMVYSHQTSSPWVLAPLKIEIAAPTAQLSSFIFPKIDIAVYNNDNSFKTQVAVKNHALSFLQPITLQIQPNGEALMHWLTLHKPALGYLFAPLNAKIISSPLDFTKPLQEQLSLQADLTLPSITLVDKTFLREFTFKDISSHLKLDAQQLQGSLQTQLSAPHTSKGKFSCALATSYEGWKDSLFSATYTNLPSSLLDSLFGYQDVFNTLGGDLLQGDLSLAKKGAELKLKGNMEGPQVALAGAIASSSSAVWLEKPVECILKLQKNVLNVASQIAGENFDSFELQSPAMVQLTMDSLYWPKSEPLELLSLKKLVDSLTHHLSKSYFHLTARVDDLKIFSQNHQETMLFDQCLVECSKATANAPVLVNINSSVGEETGHLTSSVSLQSGKDAQGTPVLLSKAQASLQRFPTLFVDAFFQMLGLKRLPPSVLLGEEINATIDAILENLSGSVDIALNAVDSQGNLNAYLTDGVVKLRKPIQATLNITPALADFFLAKMNIALTVAKDPLRLFISDQGFYFPLDPFDIKRLHLRQARADLGKILCENRGNPFEISGFFKLGQDVQRQLSLWFAPMDFTIAQGQIYIDRTEVLFNDAYQIAFWGKMDLMHNYVDMVLGLTEQSLRKALGIRGLPKSFVLQIPMTGPLDNVKIDTHVATARIAFLLAKASGLTDQAGLWGGIVNVLGDFANDQTTVPPAKPPFPWKDALSRYEAEEQRRLTNHIIH